jgi:hypothetical protein
MALQDYAELDEDDFYGQGFEHFSVVSIWVGLTDQSGLPDEADILQDLCGVGYYSVDNQESNNYDYRNVQISELLRELSYSSSFADAAINAASLLGVYRARWIIAQYDFAYQPSKVKRSVHNEPIFLGRFSYTKKC